VSIAYFTIAERKIMAAMQRREGPNVVGYWGFLQPLADGLKLILKENIIPNRSNSYLFLLAPMVNFSFSLLGWVVIPFSNFDLIYSNINYSILFIFFISIINVYGVLFAGWSSNSKYAFLGTLRVVSQMLSYEILLSVLIIPIIILSGSLNLLDIVFIQKKIGFFFLPLLPICFLFFLGILAETNRAPFDLAESESEVVGGYNIEYSSISFAFFYLGEYSNILLMSMLFSTLFLGGWLPVKESFDSILILNLHFVIKSLLVSCGFIFVRGLLPRYRYDQLILICWKKLMPFSFGFLFLIVGIFFYLG
jgi:NADH-quinone oxidoreductase subunit H